MYEVIKRRYAKDDPPPDLLVVDGGRGQLGVALSVLRDIGVSNRMWSELPKNEMNPIPEAFPRKRIGSTCPAERIRFI